MLTHAQINLYEPAILVVGTRGRSLGGFQGLLPGSVSKYCLQHSPVPVIVVRPSSKRDKARNKRALDPNRHTYKDLLEKSGHLLESDTPNIIAEDSREASEDEAAAVAAAIGYKPLTGGSPLVHAETAPAEMESKTSTSEDASGNSALDDLKSPGIVMKSPELQNLDSPEISDSSSSEEEGGVPTEETAAEAAEDDVKEDAKDETKYSEQNGSATEPIVDADAGEKGEETTLEPKENGEGT